jgi:hypothetical protein
MQRRDCVTSKRVSKEVQAIKNGPITVNICCSPPDSVAGADDIIEKKKRMMGAHLRAQREMQSADILLD